ncbi:DUF5133 domain-containing protein [Actinacidiphila sp. bgisy160]|uniref:DUF5133 domain-containing protein n=1 Tax=Actinacidiphila sp. bgisy160 TaxID=3413796 RepID=UPI003D721076
MLLAHPAVLDDLVDSHRTLRMLDPGDPEVRRRMADVSYTLCVATGTRDVDAAVALAGGVPQSLAASVWSRDLTHVPGPRRPPGRRRGLAQLPPGANGRAPARRPGYPSGHGTDLSTPALHEYQRPKTVTARLTGGS